MGCIVNPLFDKWNNPIPLRASTELSLEKIAAIGEAVKEWEDKTTWRFTDWNNSHVDYLYFVPGSDPNSTRVEQENKEVCKKFIYRQMQIKALFYMKWRMQLELCMKHKDLTGMIL